MPEKIEEKVRRFLEEMNMLKLVQNQEKDMDHLLEEFLSKDLESINAGLLLFLYTLIQSCSAVKYVKNDKLYLIVNHNNVPGQMRCFLGADIISPQIEVPSVNQFHELFEWYKKINKKELGFFASVDDLFRDRVLHSLGVVHELKEIMYNPISPLDEIPHSQASEDMLVEFLRVSREHVFLIKKRIRLLRYHEAPPFLHENAEQDLERVHLVIKCLVNKITS